MPSRATEKKRLPPNKKENDPTLNLHGLEITHELKHVRTINIEICRVCVRVGVNITLDMTLGVKAINITLDMTLGVKAINITVDITLGVKAINITVDMTLGVKAIRHEWNTHSLLNSI